MANILGSIGFKKKKILESSSFLGSFHKIIEKWMILWLKRVFSKELVYLIIFLF